MLHALLKIDVYVATYKIKFQRVRVRELSCCAIAIDGALECRMKIELLRTWPVLVVAVKESEKDPLRSLQKIGRLCLKIYRRETTRML